jgi:hypothetical protein
MNRHGRTTVARAIYPTTPKSRLRECLDRLALIYGFATANPVPVKNLRR